MNRTLKSLLVASCALIPSQALAQADTVYFNSPLAFAGSGCSPATTRGFLFPPGPRPTEFHVDFTDFVAFQPSDKISDRLKNCTITVGFHIPSGIQISIASVEYEGAAYLPAGVVGRQKSTYEFPMVSNEVTAQTVLRGPYADADNLPKDYSRTDDLAIVAWSRCGIDSVMEIETQVALGGNRTLQAEMTLNNVNGKVTQIYYINYRSC